MSVIAQDRALHPKSVDFINKCGGTNLFTLNELSALDFLVTKLISENLWGKFIALYPFIGRTADTHSINLANPNRHKIRWYGSVIHNHLGVTGNGGYGNTLVALGLLDNKNIHLSVYNATLWANAEATTPLMGTTTRTQQLSLKNTFDKFTYSCRYGEISDASGINQKLFAGNDSSSFVHIEAYGLIAGVNSQKCFVNGELFGITGTINPIDYIPNSGNGSQVAARTDSVIQEKDQYPVLIFSFDNFGTVTTKGKANIRFSSIGYGLTDDEMAKLYDIVEEFQTILQRNVGKIQLAFYNYYDGTDKITSSLSPSSLAVRKGVYDFKQNEIENITTQMAIGAIRVAGPRIVEQEESIGANVTINSFTYV